MFSICLFKTKNHFSEREVPKLEATNFQKQSRQNSRLVTEKGPLKTAISNDLEAVTYKKQTTERNVQRMGQTSWSHWPRLSGWRGEQQEREQDDDEGNPTL